MVGRRKKLLNAANIIPYTDSPLPPLDLIFQTILTALEAPEGPKLLLLRSLYYVLVSLSSSKQMCYGDADASSSVELEFGRNGSKVASKCICNLSDIIFKELSKRFELLLSASHDASVEQGSSNLDMRATADEVNMLVRCCMVILNLLEFDQDLLFEKCRVLLLILGRLCSPDLIGDNGKNSISFRKSVSSEGTYGDGACMFSIAEDFVASLRFLEQSNPCLPFLCAMLEVFLDELLVHRSLRQYFVLIDSVSSASGVLFMCYRNFGDIGSVLEVFSAHFLLSVSDEQVLENFLSRLSCMHVRSFRVPELSLVAAVSLLHHPIMLSAPKIFQAHLISSVSEAIGFGMASGEMMLDHGLMGSCLSAFERSVMLYNRHMSTLQIDGYPMGVKGSPVKSCEFGTSFQSSFESYIRPVTKNKIGNVVSNLHSSWHSYMCDEFFKTKADLVTSSIAYIKECEIVFDKCYKDDISSILNYIILNALSDDVDGILFHKMGDSSPQDIFFLASIVKLMGISMLQAIWCMRHFGNASCPRPLKDFSSCKEYDSLLNIIGSFDQFNVHLPIQKFLRDVMEAYPVKHKNSKPMLLHFAGLLSLSFVSGLGFLVNGCALIMMALMNLFIFEEGNLDVLRELLGAISEPFSSELCPNNVQEVSDRQKICLAVASKFQKIQIQRLSLMDSPADEDMGTCNRLLGESSVGAMVVHNNMDDSVGVKEVKEETLNGEVFLKCILPDPEKLSDFDDLADFIECKPGKDYSDWLKSRKRFRKWKCEKMAVLRWKKKKATKTFTKGNNLYTIR